ncbi:MAG TPA: eL32 family ribosomal protein [Candidatus Norongarragalinales archaeon]|nr:eL32 family ribosomal protein [Candidatus Norongarragalinales archaeon]
MTEEKKNVVRKLPKFVRQNRAQKKRVGAAWRKPRGIDNKLRIKEKGYGFLPKIGFRTAKSDRGLHPNGLKEVLVCSMSGLASLKGVAVRFSATIGRKKKAVLVAEAKKLKLRILNE